MIILWIGWFAAEDGILFCLQPDLLRERMCPPRGASHQDRMLVSMIRLTELARYLLAGFDRRSGWTGGFPWPVTLAAGMLCLAGAALFFWAMACNAFFSQIIRIQTNRGHTIAEGGPYRHIRPPGYLELILFEVGLSAVQGSWWAILAGSGCGILVVIRTLLEDRALKADLPGYREYAGRVKYRLVPGIW